MPSCTEFSIHFEVTCAPSLPVTLVMLIKHTIETLFFLLTFVCRLGFVYAKWYHTKRTTNEQTKCFQKNLYRYCEYLRSHLYALTDFMEEGDFIRWLAELSKQKVENKQKCLLVVSNFYHNR